MGDINELIDHLEKVHASIAEWVKFAEAKNAALLVFDMSVLAVFQHFDKDAKCLCTLGMIVIVISSLITLWTFSPNVGNKRNNRFKNSGQDNKPEGVNNLYYWGAIAACRNKEDFLRKTKDKYFPTILDKDVASEKRIEDLAEEIYINSKIAANKYGLFKVALRIDMAVFGLSILIFICA